MTHNKVKNPNWQIAKQLAICKLRRGFEPGNTENKSSQRSGRTPNSGSLNYKSSALTTRPPCLLRLRSSCVAKNYLPVLSYYFLSSASSAALSSCRAAINDLLFCCIEWYTWLRWLRHRDCSISRAELSLEKETINTTYVNGLKD